MPRGRKWCRFWAIYDNFWLDPSSTSILYVCKQRMLWLAYIISRAGSNILVQELTLIQYTCVETDSSGEIARLGRFA